MVLVDCGVPPSLFCSTLFDIRLVLTPIRSQTDLSWVLLTFGIGLPLIDAWIIIIYWKACLRLKIISGNESSQNQLTSPPPPPPPLSDTARHLFTDVWKEWAWSLVCGRPFPWFVHCVALPGGACLVWCKRAWQPWSAGRHDYCRVPCPSSDLQVSGTPCHQVLREQRRQEHQEILIHEEAVDRWLTASSGSAFRFLGRFALCCRKVRLSRLGLSVNQLMAWLTAIKSFCWKRRSAFRTTRSPCYCNRCFVVWNMGFYYFLKLFGGEKTISLLPVY